MPTLPSGSANVGEAPISFRDIWHNIHGKEGDEIPILSSQPVTNLQDLSINMASASIVLEDREGIHGARYAIDELWGSNYPSSIISNVLVKRGSSVETSFVDGETATITFNTTATNIHTASLRNSSDTVLDTNYITISGGSGTTDFASLALAEAAGYSVKITKDTFNNVYSPSFTHYDSIISTDITRKPSTTQYVGTLSTDTVIEMTASLASGTPASYVWIFGDATIQDGDGNARSPQTGTTQYVDVTYTGTGTYPVNLTINGNPSSARNNDPATQESVNIQYTQQLVSLSSNSYGINNGGGVTLYVTSRGFDGNLQFGYDTSLTPGDKSFVGSEIAVDVDTRYFQEQKSRAVTNIPTGTKYIKAFHAGDSNATVGGTSIDVQPTFTYTAANKTITAAASSNTATFTATSISANSTIAITIGPTALTTPVQSPISTTNYTTGLALSPGVYNGTYDVPFTGSADYSQVHSPVATLTVNPTVSIVKTSPTSGTFYSTSDFNDQSVTAAKHGVSPTTFTITPTVVGNTINKYIWSPSSIWAYTGGTGVNTQAPITGTFTDGGSKTWQLNVYETSGGGGTTAISNLLTGITIVRPRKLFDTQPIIVTTDTKLRRYSSYTINFQCDYIKNVKLQRETISSNWYDLVGTTATGIGNDFVDENVGPSFTIPSNASLDTTGRDMQLVDINYTSLNSLEIKNSSSNTTFKIYDRLAAVPTSVTPHDGNESIRVTWNDGVSNSAGNKIRIYSNAAGTTQVGSTVIYTDSANNYSHSHTLTTGTSRVARYFKVSGINASSEEGEISGVTSAAYVHPDCSYSTTGDTSINVDTTTNYKFETINGYSFDGDITSDPDIGSADDISSTSTTVTMTPGNKNDVYTITYENVGAAIGQTAANQTDELVVNPTATVALTPTGTSYPIWDYNSNVITQATHGIIPTVFTATPSVIGFTITTYAWALTGLELESGYTTATAALVKFKMTINGTANPTPSLTVSGNDTDGTGYFSVTTVQVRKAFSDATSSDDLRIGSTFTVTNIGVDYITRIEVWRAAAIGSDIQVGISANYASTIHFGLENLVPDTTARATYLKDTDNGAIVISLGDFAIKNYLPLIPVFTATASSYFGVINLEWNTTYATSVSITVNTGTDPGAQGSVDGTLNISGLNNNTQYTYTLTAENVNGETTTAQASATTINTTLTIGDPSPTSWTWGDTGNVTIVVNKVFSNALTAHMGYSLNATATGGTELQTLTSQGDGSTGNITLTFNKNKWDYASSLGSAITDFRAGHASAGWVVSNNSVTVNDFSTPNAATNFTAVVTSGTTIELNWTWPQGTNTGIEVWGGPESLPSVLSTITNTSTTSYVDYGLDPGETVEYYLRTYYSRTADSTTRTKYASTSILSRTTTAWTNIIVVSHESSFNPGAGNGWDDPEDAYLKIGIDSYGTLHYLDSETLGTDTVNLKKNVDGNSWNGRADWYTTYEGDAVLKIGVDGSVIAGDHYTDDHVPPKPPITFGTTVNSPTSVTITWDNVSAIETGYKVYRKLGTTVPTYVSGTYDAVYTVGANVETYTNTGLSSNTQYTWSVYAYRGDSYSTKINGTATTYIAPTVSSFTLSSGSAVGEVDLSWTTSNADTVDVWRSTSSNYDSLVLIVDDGGANSSFTDTGLTGGTVYYYRIKATGNGAISGATDGNERATSVSVAYVSTSPTSWTWGDSGNVTFTFNKNFSAAVIVSMQDGTTTMQTHSFVGHNQTGDIGKTFYKSYFSATGTNVVDFIVTDTSYSPTYLDQNSVATVNDIEVASAPTGLAVVAGSIGILIATWNARTSDCTGYKIYMASTYAGNYNLVVTHTANNQTTRIQTGLGNNVTRYFKIACINVKSAGNASYPNGVVSHTEVGDQGTGVGGTTQGGTGNSCFDLDSMVTMADNTVVRLGDLQVDDVIKSFTYSDMIDESDGPYEVYSQYTNSSLDDGYFTTSVVKEMHYYTIPENAGYIVTFNENETLKVSVNHPVWVYVQEDNLWQWRLPSHIVAGDKLMGVNKTEHIVNSVIMVEEEWEAAYPNVEEVDTCFVQGVLVHNGK